MTENNKKAVVFGGLGAIGAAVCTALERDGFSTTPTTSRDSSTPGLLTVRSDATSGMSELAGLRSINAVVWSQGLTNEDSVANFSEESLRDMLGANLMFVASTLRYLLDNNSLANGCRLCVISSIWEEQSRPNRFSYTISKAAVGGLVRSVAIDLADRGFLINSVEPGVVESAMSARLGSSAATFSAWTPHHRNLAAVEVAELVAYLVSARNTAVTGQSIAVDLGSTIARLPANISSDGS